MQQRYYDPVVGRFYSNDPIGFRDTHSFNRYAYANNNPYKYVDPFGMASKSSFQECEDDANCTNVIGHNQKTENSIEVKMPDGKLYWVDKEMYFKNIGSDYLAKQAGATFSDYVTTTKEEWAKAAGYSGMLLTGGGSGIVAYLGYGLTVSAAWLHPSPDNLLGAVIGKRHNNHTLRYVCCFV